MAEDTGFYFLECGFNSLTNYVRFVSSLAVKEILRTNRKLPDSVQAQLP